MVAVVVAMCVLVLGPVVHVLVRMRFGQVQNDASEHQRRSDQQHEAERALAHRHGDPGADEGCECEDRTCSRRTERALRQQVEAKAQPISGRPDEQQSEGSQRIDGARAEHIASTVVAQAPIADLYMTTWLGSRSASPLDRLLSMPHAADASMTASSPHTCAPPACP